MAHRAVEIAWTPRSAIQWTTFTKARLAVGALWSAMVKIHARIRRLQWKWPSFARWCAWAKGRSLGLSAQSVQQVVAEFIECLSATTAARNAQRKLGEQVTENYTTRAQKYRHVTYTNQGAVIRDGFLRLCCGGGCGRGRGIYLRVKLPGGLVLPGPIAEVTLHFGVVRIVCKVPDVEFHTTLTVVGGDFGVNSIIAATDGNTAIVVSGREAKAIVQYRNKRLGEAFTALDKCKPGSRKHKKLSRRKRKMLRTCNNKIRDIAHKATRAVANTFHNAKIIVGKPFGEAAAKIGRTQAQQVSSACTGRMTRQFEYKMAGTQVVSEAWSSQACPVCGRRQKCRRVYRCKRCGLVAPRDVVGAVNIRAIGLYGRLMPKQSMPTRVVFVRPLHKYRGGSQGPPRSSGGTPACRPETEAQCVPKSTRSTTR